MARGVAASIILFCLVIAALLLAMDNRPGARHEERITLLLGEDGRRQPSMLGVFPPSHVVDQKNWSELGIRVPKWLPQYLQEAPIEVRSGPRGSYLVSIGQELYLTHRPVTEASEWTLYIPKESQGPLHIASTLIDTRAALGIERPGEFARVTWQDGRWHYTLFSPVGHSLEALFAIGASLQ